KKRPVRSRRQAKSAPADLWNGIQIRPMRHERHRRGGPMNEESIFMEALQKPPEERAAFMDQACGDNAELRQSVALLLQAHEQAGPFLQGGPENRGTIAQHCEAPGTVIGSYKLIEQIGEGGMGTVWMAQQTQPVKRVVALKVIKAGMDSKQIIARFEA